MKIFNNILIFLIFRGHDICLEVTGEYLAPGQCKNGLCNFSPFTRSPCGCDHNFVRCLKKAKTKIANTLGKFLLCKWASSNTLNSYSDVTSIFSTLMYLIFIQDVFSSILLVLHVTSMTIQLKDARNTLMSQEWVKFQLSAIDCYEC